MVSMRFFIIQFANAPRAILACTVTNVGSLVVALIVMNFGVTTGKSVKGKIALVYSTAERLMSAVVRLGMTLTNVFSCCFQKSYMLTPVGSLYPISSLYGRIPSHARRAPYSPERINRCLCAYSRSLFDH